MAGSTGAKAAMSGLISRSSSFDAAVELADTIEQLARDRRDQPFDPGESGTDARATTCWQLQVASRDVEIRRDLAHALAVARELVRREGGDQRLAAPQPPCIEAVVPAA
jgi:hypothetical protein